MYGLMNESGKIHVCGVDYNVGGFTIILYHEPLAQPLLTVVPITIVDKHSQHQAQLLSPAEQGVCPSFGTDSDFFSRNW